MLNSGNKILCAKRKGTGIECIIKKKISKAGDRTLGKIRLSYTFNNPNPTDDTAEMLLKFFIEANKPRVEKAVKNAVDNSEKTISHSA